MSEINYFDQLMAALNKTTSVSITDTKGKILFGNEKFCETTGYSLPEILGKDHRILNSGFHKRDFYENIWSTILSGKTWFGEFQNKKKSGEFYWEQGTISAIYDDKGDIQNFVSIRIDITKMKQAQEQLSESSRLAALGEMASGIAHEINNPLTIILGRLTIAEKKLDRNDSPDVIKKELQTIEKTVFRISNIVSGLKKLSRNATFDPVESFDVVQTINDTKDLFVQKLNKYDIKFDFKNTEPIWVEAKPLQISQTVLNLVNNSVDAIESFEEKWIRIEIDKVNSKYILKVIDSGKGIPKELIEKIMTPFFTTKDPGKGTGLGLSLSKKMVEDSGGRFFYDAQGANTTFCIELNAGEPVSKAA